MSRFVLISPAHSRVENDNLDPPLGLMYLSASLKQAGHEVKILDFAGQRQHEIPEADIYGFTTYTPTYWWSLEKRDEIRQLYPKAKFIAGGAHVSALPAETAKDWDCVVVGEGEQAIDDMATNGIDRCVYYSQPIYDVDSIPCPDYADIDMDSYDRLLLGRRLFSVFSSRGCPYKCAFCNSVIWKGSHEVRFRDPFCVAAEIGSLCAEYGIDCIGFVDDLFAISEGRVKELTDALRPLDIIYRCTARCSNFTADMADNLVSSGCVQVNIGVESGSNDVLVRGMGKKQTKEQIRRAIDIAKSSGLFVRVYLIVGAPYETWESVNETCELMLECMPSEINVRAPVPFPGTAWYDNPEEYGITWIDENFRNYMPISKDKQAYYLMSHQTADKDEIGAMREYAVDKLSPIAWNYGKE